MIVQQVPLFPSLLHVAEIKDFDSLKENLILWIKSYQSTQNNHQVSGRNAWQSPTNFFRKEKSFFKYKLMIEKSISIIINSFTVKKYKITNMWININGPGGYNVSHTHPDSHLSGVFWISAPKNCGVLRFESPNHFTQYEIIKSYSENIKQSLNLYHDFWLEPSEGKLIIFPSDIRHFVETNQSNDDRISISFNISFVD